MLLIAPRCVKAKLSIIQIYKLRLVQPLKWLRRAHHSSGEKPELRRGENNKKDISRKTGEPIDKTAMIELELNEWMVVRSIDYILSYIP